MSRAELRPQFVAGGRGRVFALLRRAAGDAPGGVLIVPPFAEEMNKSRHLFTEVATLLADRGVSTLVVDLFGTGDSEGEFADADWEVWKQDLAAVVAWAESEGVRIDRMLAVRLGCMLGAEFVRASARPLLATVFWQPVLAGARALDQFLRLRVAASMMQKDGKETIAALRTKLRGGEVIEVAGYALSGRLVEQIDRAVLGSALDPKLGSIHWMEIVRAADAQPPTPAVETVASARGAGMRVELQTIVSEPFWSSVEIVRSAELVDNTIRSLGVAS